MKDKQKFNAMQFLHCIIIPPIVLLHTLCFSTVLTAGSLVQEDDNSASERDSRIPATSDQYVDVAASLHTKTAHSIKINNEIFDAVGFDSTFVIFVNLSNQGNNPASNIQLKFTLPIEATVLNQSLAPVYAVGNLMYWSLAVPPKSDTTIVVSLSGRLDTEGSRSFSIEMTTEGDIDVGDNKDTISVWFLDSSREKPTYFNRSKNFTTTIGTSIDINDDDMKFTKSNQVFDFQIEINDQGSAAAHQIKVKNKSATNRKLVDFISDSLLSIKSGQIYPTDITIANSSSPQVGTFGQPDPPFEPKVEITPANATVMDSIWLRVQFPVQVSDWDVHVQLPNGELVQDFADRFISRTIPDPNVWYVIDEPFTHTRLLGGGAFDEIVFTVYGSGVSGNSGVASQIASIKSSFALAPPNVVSPESDGIPIDFVVPGGYVEMKLYDVAGRFITNLIDAPYEAGRHTLQWNGLTEQGQIVGSGVYLITMSTDTDNTWKKMIIVR